jgi:D-threo-aldose 1-dehydrogenase
MKIPTRPVGRGARTLALSSVGFGAAPIGNMHRAITEEEAEETIEAAWEAGIRYFDTAPLYGHGLSERRIGSVLRHKPRDSFVISTKVGRVLESCGQGEQPSGIYVATPPVRARFAYDYEGVMSSFETSLERLRLDRVDILYVHDVDAMTHGSSEAAEARIAELLDEGGWKALSELRSAGTVSAIGLGVNENRACEIMLKQADPDIFLLAGRYTLLDRSAADVLLPACLERGVSVVLGGPYNSGILATGPTESAYYDYRPASEAILERTRAIEATCCRFGVKLSDAALQFPLRHRAIVCVIPGSQSTAQVRQNVESFTRDIPEALWEALS